MDGPSKTDLAFKDNDDDTVTATYKPTEPGTYKLTLKFTHFNLKGKFNWFHCDIFDCVKYTFLGSPFTITCT